MCANGAVARPKGVDPYPWTGGPFPVPASRGAPGCPGVSVGVEVAEEPIASQTVLAIFPVGEDCELLTSILGPANWQVHFIRTLEEARVALRASSFGVVMSAASFSDSHCWKDLLREMQDLASPPPLIVADRLADERLWAEVLNLGGYDLLARVVVSANFHQKYFSFFGSARLYRLQKEWKPP